MATGHRRGAGVRRAARVVVRCVDVGLVTAVAVAVEVGLRTTSLPRLARLVGAPLDVTAREGATGPVTSNHRALRQQEAVARVLRHWPWGDTCLRRALVLGHRVRRLDPVLRVGVAKVDGQVSAHAWLEVDGGSLDPSGAGTFVPLRSSEAVPQEGRGATPQPGVPSRSTLHR